MDDVAGCRLIFKDINALGEFRGAFHEARFKHERLNDVDRYDYIKASKSTGYRGIHDVYVYDVNSKQGEPLKGLLIEIQYRTLVQHAWATAVELIGFLTASRPKFQEGDKRYVEIMKYASEILARIHEGRKSCLPNLTNEEVVKGFLELEKQLDLMALLKSLNAKETEYTSNRNLILIFDQEGRSEVRSYRDATDALRALFELEATMKDKDIVLVKADISEEARAAFRILQRRPRFHSVSRVGVREALWKKDNKISTQARETVIVVGVSSNSVVSVT